MERLLQQFVAIVLAGDRTKRDPVARDADVACKAIAPVHGTPMIMRVLDALESSGVIGSIILCGPPESALEECPELSQRIKDANITRIANLDSPCLSAEAGLSQLDAEAPVILTTADHALLTAEIVANFALESVQSGADAAVALVEHDCVRKAFPGTRRTVIRLREGNYCGCNLFALLNTRGYRLVAFWRPVEQSRKRPWRLISGIFGPWELLSYLLGSLSLERALGKISNRLGIKLETVVLPYPEAGIDVDTPQDLVLVEKVLADQAGTAS